MKELRRKTFANGVVYALQTEDGYPIEVTDTFLPYYTKFCVNGKTNRLVDTNLGSRKERFIIGVSCMSGCPVGCKFCATGSLKKWRNLTACEIYDQVLYIFGQNTDKPSFSQEFKINYTRMGEPFLNIDAVKDAIKRINVFIPETHHYVSTIGIRGSDFSWIEGNVTLQISLHSLDESRRNELIPIGKKMTIQELGQIRTKSKLKTTVNLTLVDEKDFDIKLLKKWFDPEFFFVKLSPINKNVISESNQLGDGIIEAENLL